MRTSGKVCLVVAMVVFVVSCSSHTDTASSTRSSMTARGSHGRSAPTPAAHAATFGGPLSGGNGIWMGTAEPGPDLAKAGYTEAEYTASGTATSYTGTRPTDGRFELQPAATAPYETRVVVRRPAKAADFDGTVVVEWLNVTGGADASPEYTYLADEILRRGEVWVGVSAQHIGVEGGPIAVTVPFAEALGAGKGIKNLDPARYSSLHHPGDAFSYDMYTQVGQALRGHGAIDPLKGLEVDRLLAVGESQSAFMLTTYVDGVQPLTHEFDGFLIHSRGGTAPPLGKPGAGIDVIASLVGEPTTIRTDSDVPTMLVETETDLLVLGYYSARQPDDDHLRLWEVAGSAHADKDQVGDTEAHIGCPSPVNRGQQRFVLRSALRHLVGWIERGTMPPSSPRIDVVTSGASPAFAHDQVGNVTGGVRTPLVDAPVDVLSGLQRPDASLVCVLFGTTTPIPADQLHQMYPTRAAYVVDYRKATDAAIAKGFVLAADRSQVIADSSPARVPS
jgi:Alpha/beta hydrolase domain